MKPANYQRYRQGLVFSLALLCGRIPSCRVRRWLYRHVFHVRIGRDSVIYGGAEIRAAWNVGIGDHSSIGHYAVLDGRGGLDIGNNVNLSSGVWIWTQQHDVQSPDFAIVDGPVVIDDYAWISCRAVILPNVRIGRGAVVAAGAVVTKDVAPFTIVGGVPAQVIGYRSQDLRYELNWHQPFF